MAEVQAGRPYMHLLYHFCRLRLPNLAVPYSVFARDLERAYEMFRAKKARAQASATQASAGGQAPEGLPTWMEFVEKLHTLDWFLACACRQGQPEAWEGLFSARANKTDALLVDALRMRAVRLFPRDEGRQEQAVADFWGFLLAGEKEGSVPILARYDGQRPLVPWLIRVFHNKLLTESFRPASQLQPLPEDDLNEPPEPPSDSAEERWHEEFRVAAQEWFQELSEQDMLLLGLRLRYRLSQREVAGLLGIHEGNVTRRIQRLRDRCLEQIGQALQSLGWTGDDLSGFVLKEMDTVLLDEPRLSADRLASILAALGKEAPAP
jgi:RNA polymerase sigma factor (sigma-70 family)